MTLRDPDRSGWLRVCEHLVMAGTLVFLMLITYFCSVFSHGNHGSEQGEKASFDVKTR